jgi:hypothetical protein
MGIQGLTTYMERYYSKWRDVELKGHLVLDGYSICYSLYSRFNLDNIHGGQYWLFRMHVKEFFRILQRNSITSLVVFDGIDYKMEKEHEMLRRKRERVRLVRKCLLEDKPRLQARIILPLFCVEVFKETLRELKIEFFFVDGEGDWDTVAMANHHRCPVVAYDSDYFMYNIDGGYIPIDNLYWNNSPITARLYLRADFVTKFTNFELAYALPAMIGNDFLRKELVTHAIKDDIYQNFPRRKFVCQLICYLADFASPEDFFAHLFTLDKSTAPLIKENFEKAKKMYIVSYTLSGERGSKFMSETELVTRSGMDIPKWMLDQYRRGYFSSNVMSSFIIEYRILRVVIDNPLKESSQLCSRPIRQYIYAILLPYIGRTTVTEIIRFDATLRKELVYVATDVLNLPTIDRVHEISVLDRKRAFCTVMECDLTLLDGFEDKWKIPLAATCYWVKHARPENLIIQSLILSFMLCSRDDKDPTSLLPQRITEYRNRHWLDVLHSFTAWQSVYYDAMTLNNVLYNPFRFVNPALLFDGELVMYVACQKHLSSIIKRDLQELVSNSRMYQVVLSFLPHSEKSKSQIIKPVKPKAIKTVQEYSVDTTNKFAMLRLESDEEDNDDDD